MGDMPHNRHGLIPMLVAIRVAHERKRRAAEAGGEEAGDEAGSAAEPKKKKRGWFG